MDLRKLKKLIDLVQESGIGELEITEGEERVRIARGGIVNVTPLAAPATAAPVPAAAAAAPAAASAAAAEPAAGQEGHVVKSPMVGTFYRSPSPDAKPFIEVGGTVKEGQTICVIEAMKLFHEVRSERDGTVEAILIASGQEVEAGQPLIRIR